LKKKHFYTRCAGLSVYALLTLYTIDGGGGEERDRAHVTALIKVNWGVGGGV
jgi:hypothetical protein